jgi:hypothetical protein
MYQQVLNLAYKLIENGTHMLKHVAAVLKDHTFK